MTSRIAILASLMLASTAIAQAEIQTEITEYQHESAILEGTLVYDDQATEPQPGVVIFHQWGGAGAYEVARAKMLAEQGYVVLVADIYSKGIRPGTFEERRALATAYYGDRPIVRARARAALETLKASTRVNPEAIGAVGYCFGGMVALELARDGAPFQAAVTVHGALNTPTPEDANNIVASILTLHGQHDPYVPVTELEAFRKEMSDASVDFRIVEYDAVHSFSDWDAGNDPSTGAAYNEAADKASWQEILSFLGEKLKGSPATASEE